MRTPRPRSETIVCPDSWWHYAVSLTPSITLMCNFWDGKNKAGLREIIMKGCSPAPPTHELRPVRAMKPAGGGVVVLRDRPDADAPTIGVVRAGEALIFDAECAEWLRTAQPATAMGAARGWAHAAALVRA